VKQDIQNKEKHSETFLLDLESEHSTPEWSQTNYNINECLNCDLAAWPGCK